MSLQWQLSREVPADIAEIGQRLLPKDNLYRQIGDRFNELFPEESVFDAFHDTAGRGVIPRLLLALVTVLQMMERVPDRTAADFVVSRLDWKYALHLPLGFTGFHFTNLNHWRALLEKKQDERVFFDELVHKLQAAGLIKNRGKMRTDSTHILAVVQRLGQMELVSETVRLALRATTEVASDWVEQTVPGDLQERYSERQREYGLTGDEVRRKLVLAGTDGFRLLDYVDQSAPQVVRVLSAIETLRQVLSQQFPAGPEQPPTSKRPTGGDIVESPHEAEARRGTKRRQSWTGYKLQITETCDEDQPRLIVEIEVTGALENDSPELPKVQERLEERGTLPGEQQVDQGYMSGKNLVTSAARGVNLMGKPLADTQGPEGFRQGDFQIDESAKRATCPEGQTSKVWAECKDPAGGPSTIKIRFDATTCQQCACFGKCTSSTKGRSLTLNPYREALETRRSEAKTEAFLTKLHIRAGIEATISEAVRRYGLRSARYRGRARLRLQAYFTAVAMNLRRLGRWWAQARPQAALAGVC
jgi:transposase